MSIKIWNFLNYSWKLFLSMIESNIFMKLTPKKYKNSKQKKTWSEWAVYFINIYIYTEGLYRDMLWDLIQEPNVCKD